MPRNTMNTIAFRRIDDLSPSPNSKGNVKTDRPRPEANLLFSIEPPAVIGRGPLLKCASTKVSRSHAEINWDDNGILITSTHRSPTYVTVAGKEKVLCNGQSAVLNSGDEVKLLKDEFFYKVEIQLRDRGKYDTEPEENIEETDKISENKRSMENDLHLSPERRKEIIDCKADTVNQNENWVKDLNIPLSPIKSDNVEETHNQNDKSTKSDSSESREPHQRKLPQWMMNCAKNKAQDETKNNQTPKQKMHGRANVSAKKHPAKFVQDSVDDETKNSKKNKNTSEFGNVAKRKKKSNEEKKKYHAVSLDQNLSETEMSGKDQHGISEEENDPELNQTSADSGEGNSNDSSRAPGNTNDGPRIPCQYGGSCYRRNPSHKRNFSHPGDSDYASPDESDDEKPECEFGVSCYRQNPQHKKTYKHTRKPQQQRAAKKKAKRRQKEEGEDIDSENEYDLNDSFLNDDSSDDYQPTDSSDDSGASEDGVEEEDTKRMLKEANRFKKRSK